MRQLNQQKQLLFNEYQEYINMLSEHTTLEEFSLENIKKINILKGYSNNVCIQLLQKEYLYEYIVLSLNNSSEINFDDEKIVSLINEKKQSLIERQNIFSILRKRIVKEKKSTILKYLFLFDSNSPIITENEIDCLSESSLNDTEILSFISPELLSDSDKTFFINFVNRRFHINSESKKIFSFILNLNNESIYEVFYKLDFDKVKYYSFSKANKNWVKESFGNALKLGEIKEKIKFMKETFFWDVVFEEEIIKIIKSDKAYEKDYMIAVCNAKNSICEGTIDNIIDLSSYYITTENLEKAFLRFGAYKHYVVSKTCRQGYFQMEEFTEIDLWPVYCEIFKGVGFKKTNAFMLENNAFLEKFQKKHEYIGMSEETRIKLAAVWPDQDCIRNVITQYSNEFAIKYFKKIGGFKNNNAAKTFVNLVGENEDLLKSDALYQHTRDLLNNNSLKRSYSMKRTNYFKQK